MKIPYHPISCEFHDVLETLATVRRPAQIRFRADDGDVHQRRAVITDVYSRDGAEYLVLDSGETLRLDRLIAVT
jgi:Rho-binding antiterminator